MSFISNSKNFKIPLKIANVIHKRNRGSTLTRLDSELWIVESPTLFVYKNWFHRALPYPWDDAIYNLLYNISWGTNKKKFDNLFLLSDTPFSTLTLPVPSDLSVFIDELAKKYNLNHSETILGLLYQMMDSMIQISDN